MFQPLQYFPTNELNNWNDKFKSTIDYYYFSLCINNSFKEFLNITSLLYKNMVARLKNFDFESFTKKLCK